MTLANLHAVARNTVSAKAMCPALRTERGSRQFLEAGAGRTGEIHLLFAEPQLIPSPSLASRLG